MYKFTSLEHVKQHPIVKKFIMISVAILSVFILMLFLPWQQTVYGTGVLTALNPTQRDYKVAATIDGFVEEIYVKENQFVKKGQKLFKMVDLDEHYQSSLLSIKNESIQKYENELIKLHYLQDNLKSLYDMTKISLEIHDKKISQAHNILETLQEQKVALKNKKSIAFINYERINKLYKEGIESKRSLELNYANYLQTNAQYKKLLLEIQTSKNELQIAKQNRENFQHTNDVKINTLKNKILYTKNSINTYEQNIKKNNINLARYQKREVVAKTEGYVVRIYVNDKNRLIKKGEDILYFSPVVTKRAIRVQVSDFHMPLIKEGLQARIIFYGWPALQVSGWPKIQHGTYAGIITKIERSTYEKGVYYAIITEDESEANWPSNDYLKIGTQSSLWIKLSTVPIWYEIWRLMFSLPPKMTTIDAKINDVKAI